MTDDASVFRVAYVSRNIGEMDEAGLHELLRKSRHNNVRRGVTGALLFSPECFAQVLEGPIAEVETLFERIQCDSRHSDVVILMSERGVPRQFGEWAMAYAGDDDAQRVRFAAMSYGDLAAGASAAAPILDILRGAVGRAEPALPLT